MTGAALERLAAKGGGVHAIPPAVHFVPTEHLPKPGEWLYRPDRLGHMADLIIDLTPYEVTTTPQRLKGTVIRHRLEDMPNRAVVYELPGTEDDYAEIAWREVWRHQPNGRIIARVEDGDDPSTWVRTKGGVWIRKRTPAADPKPPHLATDFKPKPVRFVSPGRRKLPHHLTVVAS
jgi:hypothetical protein